MEYKPEFCPSDLPRLSGQLMAFSLRLIPVVGIQFSVAIEPIQCLFSLRHSILMLFFTFDICHGFVVFLFYFVFVLLLVSLR